MKVLINRQPVDGPWGGGNLFVQAAYKYLPEFGYTPVTSLKELPEIILMVDPRYDGMGISINEIAGYAKHYYGTDRQRVVVHRINECDARKGTTDVDPLLAKCQDYVTERVFVSNWLRDHLVPRIGDAVYGSSSENPVIYNGVDQELFRRVEIPRTFDKTRIVTHHWSDNPMKGLDVTVWLDEYFIPKYRDQFEYTYIGRLKHQLKNSTLIPPCFGQELVTHLSKGDVYVSASRFDPGPNHILEALSCGLKTFVHSDGGGAVEFAGNDHTYGSLEELEKILLTPLAELQDNNAMTLPTWRECIEQYAKLFDELASYMP